MTAFPEQNAIEKPAPATALPRVRWAIASILLLASAVNYVDRQALSILAPVIQRDFHIGDNQYAMIVEAFLLCYAVAYLLSGNIVDWIGARVAEAGFLIWWSAASILTAVTGGFASLLLVRGMLGLGEPGNFTAGAKVASKWFAPSERGVAVGMYSMGGTIGAAIAAPLVAFLAIGYGWRLPFVVIGVAGLILAAAWFLVYREPAMRAEPETEQRTSLRRLWKPLSRSHGFWAILVARVLTDPVWYFYLFWFPKYLEERRGMSLREIGTWLWVVFVAADLGALAGGLISARVVKSGRTPVRARLWVMGGAMIVIFSAFLTPRLPSDALVLTAASATAFAHMAWMTNATTLPIDLFPRSYIGSIQGAIGSAASFAGFLSTAVVGMLVVHVGYQPIFTFLGVLYVVALGVLLFVLYRPKDSLGALA